MTDTAVRDPASSPAPPGPDADRAHRRDTTLSAAANVAVVVVFVLAAWWLDPVRELSALVAERLPTGLYVLTAAAIAWPWLRRALPAARERATSGVARVLGLLVRRSGPAAGVLAYLIPLFGGWETARSPYMVGGIIPWSDATLYFGGAQRVLFGDGVDEYGAGRPIHPAFLAIRLAVTGMDLRKALVIGSVLLGIACFLAARAVARDLGLAAGLALFAGIYGFAAPAGGSLMTEGLGVTFGALALAALWTAARGRNVPLALAGLVLLTVAQAVRTGALLVLPVLAFWLAWHHRQKGQVLNWRVLGLAVGAGVVGVAVNVAAVVATSGNVASLHGHSGYFLYGLARGAPAWNPAKPNWTLVYADFPNRSLTGAEGSKFVNDQAMQAIKDHPVLFGKTVVRSALNYARGSQQAALTPVRTDGLRRAITLVALLAAAGLLATRRRDGPWSLATDVVLFGAAVAAVVPLRDPWRLGGMYPAGLFAAVTAVAFVAFVVFGTRRISDRAPLSFAVAGLVACAAFAPLLGADLDSARNFAATVPLMALPFALAAAVLVRAAAPVPAAAAPLAPAPPARPWAPALVGAGMLGAAVVGAPVAAALIERPAIAERTCPDGRKAQAFLGGVALHIVADGFDAENDRDQLESSILEKLAPYGWRMGPATVPGTVASESTGTTTSGPGQGPRTMLGAITADGDDRVAYINGDVEAPGSGVLYVCGQDETDGISVNFSRVFWPKPVTFAFFTGVPLPD